MSVDLDRIGPFGKLPPGANGVAECFSCQAPIFWCYTAKANRMPVDAEPDPRGELGITVGALVSKWVSGPRYTSHFATCPNAARHRRISSRRDS